MTQLEAEALVRAEFGLDVDVAFSRSCPRGRGTNGRAPRYGIALMRKVDQAPGFEVLGAGSALSGLAAFREAWRAAKARLAAAASPPPPPPPVGGGL